MNNLEKNSVFSQNNFPLQVMKVQAATMQAITDEKTQKDFKNTNKLLTAIPIVDSFIAGAGRKTLAGSLGTFSGRLASWGIAIGAFNLISKGINKITSKSKNLQEMQEQHPLVKNIIDISAMIGIYNIGSSFVNKALTKVPKGTLKKGLTKSIKIANNINSSTVAKKVYNPIRQAAENILENHSTLRNIAKRVTPYIVPTMIAGAIVKTTVINPKKLENRIVKNLNS